VAVVRVVDVLGAGALVALAFAAVEAAVASSTSARTSWCLVAAMVLSYLDAESACLFCIVESVASATGTPTGSKTLGANEGLGAWIGCAGT